MKNEYDIIILGSGPGGYSAAIRASQLGMSVALIEKEKNLGGICANWGCIPTKSLLHDSELQELSKTAHAKELGIKHVSEIKNFSNAIRHSRDIANTMSGGVEMLMKKHKIDVIKGIGQITDNNSVTVKNNDVKSDTIVKAGNIIIATGASARSIPGIKIEKNIWSYKEALSPKKLPQSMVIVGSGAIGLEFASVYNAFGCQIHVIEAADRILPSMDSTISSIAQKALEKRGVKFTVKAKIQSATQKKKITSVIDVDGKIQKIESDVLLIAAGVVGNTENIGLEKLAIHKTESGFIAVNDRYKTSANNIYAIGDIVGGMCLAHKASHEAIMCVNGIAGKTINKITNDMIPSCIYSNPQVASIGMTEEEVKKHGKKYKIGMFNYSSCGKAVAIGETTGLIKVIADIDYGEILGVHIVGYNATEIIHSCIVAKHLEATYKDMQHIIFAHPTISEIIPEAFLDLDDLSING